MFSEGIILKCPTTGECEIDVERIKQEWHEGAVIYCHEEYKPKLDLFIPTFQLVEHTSDPDAYKGRSLKVTISQSDAIKLIYDLGLVPERNLFLKRNISYRKPQ